MLQSFSDFIFNLMTFLLYYQFEYWESSEKELPNIQDTVVAEKVKIWSLSALDNFKLALYFQKILNIYVLPFLVFLSSILFFIYQMFTVFILSSNVKKKRCNNEHMCVHSENLNPEIFFSVRLVWHNSEKLQVSVVGDLY